MRTIILIVVCSLSVAGELPLSPAQKRIAAAEAAIRKETARWQHHNDLALALARRARETGDPAWYQKADKAIQESLRLAPGNFEAAKLRVWVLLGKHEFSAAREAALELNRRAPDDVLVYGFLVDANVELGNYADAEKAAQWMLDLRPGNVPGLTRAAYLRELFGDLEGALDFMQKALRRTHPREVEDRAWILTQMARLQLSSGKPEIAGRLAEEALRLFPGYHYALARMAEIRTAERRFAEALEYQRQHYSAAPHPENLYELAQALEHAGKRDEAAECYARFEQLARAEMEGNDNANRELILYYAGPAGKPAEALRISRREIERRRDVRTLDAHAWALHVNGLAAEARENIRSALAVGTRDPIVLEHARAIDGATERGQTSAL
jgi:tetratricopeptide (TPR) repeat protein